MYFLKAANHPILIKRASKPSNEDGTECRRILARAKSNIGPNDAHQRFYDDEILRDAKKGPPHYCRRRTSIDQDIFIGNVTRDVVSKNEKSEEYEHDDARNHC